jgi:hypothetical protein
MKQLIMTDEELFPKATRAMLRKYSRAACQTVLDTAARGEGAEFFKRRRLQVAEDRELRLSEMLLIDLIKRYGSYV